MQFALAIGWTVGVKFLGYWGAATTLRDWYGMPGLATWKVGALRTMLGWLGAACVFGILSLKPGDADFLALVTLGTARLVEWFVVFAVFFERDGWRPQRALPRIIAATAWSWFLDIPVLAGLIPTMGSFC